MTHTWFLMRKLKWIIQLNCILLKITKDTPHAITVSLLLATFMVHVAKVDNISNVRRIRWCFFNFVEMIVTLLLKTSRCFHTFIHFCYWITLQARCSFAVLMPIRTAITKLVRLAVPRSRHYLIPIQCRRWRQLSAKLLSFIAVFVTWAIDE